MLKRIKINKKIILLIIFVLLLIGYYIYNEKNKYKEFKIESNNEEILIQDEPKEEKEIIVVHITGEINNEGVLELEEGARIIDAVNKAGGFTENADSEKINLAYILTDGVKINIPNKNEKQEDEEMKPYITVDSGDNVIMEENKMETTNNLIVNINKATQSEFETLPGIGPSIAAKIIEYRKQNGSFNKIDEIKNVSGIGENKFEKIKNFIIVQ